MKMLVEFITCKSKHFRDSHSIGSRSVLIKLAMWVSMLKSDTIVILYMYVDKYGALEDMISDLLWTLAR